MCSLFYSHMYKGFEKGGLPYGKLQPFSEWLQSPWACRWRCHRANPFQRAKKEVVTFRLRLPFSFYYERDSNKEGAKRKKTVQYTVFADVGNERKRGDSTR